MNEMVNLLSENAYQDYKLLELNDEKGDDFSQWRDVDFILYAESESKAKAVVSFIDESCYGRASYQRADDNYRIIVAINMAPTQNILNSISALMVCMSKIFGLKYSGWSSSIEQSI